VGWIVAGEPLPVVGDRGEHLFAANAEALGFHH